jgi:hypothetical protein
MQEGFKGLNFDLTTKILQFRKVSFLAIQLGWNEYKYEKWFYNNVI